MVVTRYATSTEHSALFLPVVMSIVSAPVYHNYNVVAPVSMIVVNGACLVGFAQQHLIGKTITWSIMLQVAFIPLVLATMVVATLSYQTKSVIRELRRTNVELNAANSAKNLFLGTIGHEVRYV